MRVFVDTNIFKLIISAIVLRQLRGLEPEGSFYL